MKQADEAIKLYLNHYRGTQTTGDHQTLPEISIILANTTNLLRLKRYSYRTEQTYLDWIKRFSVYPLTREAQRSDAIT